MQQHQEEEKEEEEEHDHRRSLLVQRDGPGLAAAAGGVGAVGDPSSSPRYAFMTLLYSDFVEGTRALGRSLERTKSKAERVVLVTPDVTAEARSLLAADGWRVMPVSVMVNPNDHFQGRLLNVYTKLKMYTMTEYQRVVFLDSDMLILENIDELFDCEGFCAVMRHSELLNSGTLVITPSLERYTDMQSKLGVLDSYTGGDQGFFNSYYPDFAACPLFEPFSSLHATQREEEQLMVQEASTPDLQCRRLPTRYNGDWPLLFVNGDVQTVQQHMEDAPPAWQERKRVRILHYTFGTAKPWQWWSLPLLPFVDLWQATYNTISPSGGIATGVGGGVGGLGGVERAVASSSSYHVPLVSVWVVSALVCIGPPLLFAYTLWRGLCIALRTNAEAPVAAGGGGGGGAGPSAALAAAAAPAVAGGWRGAAAITGALGARAVGRICRVGLSAARVGLVLVSGAYRMTMPGVVWGRSHRTRQQQQQQQQQQRQQQQQQQQQKQQQQQYQLPHHQNHSVQQQPQQLVIHPQQSRRRRPCVVDPYSLTGQLYHTAMGLLTLLLALGVAFASVVTVRERVAYWRGGLPLSPPACWLLFFWTTFVALLGLGGAYLKAVCAVASRMAREGRLEDSVLLVLADAVAGREGGRGGRGRRGGGAGGEGGKAPGSGSGSGGLASSLVQESLLYAAVLTLSLAWLSMQSYLRGLNGLPISSMVGRGLGVLLATAFLACFASTRLPLLWSAYVCTSLGSSSSGSCGTSSHVGNHMNGQRWGLGSRDAGRPAWAE